MDAAAMEVDIDQHPPSDPLPFARCYQLEALDMALKQNTIVYLETGSGKTLIATMLLRSYAYQIRKPSPYIAVFLVPKVVLVSQQAEVLKMHTDLKVGMYWGEMGVDFWNAALWRQEIEKHEVLVMTPAILLHVLRHRFFKMEMIKVLIFDECQHASGKHPYACIMTEFYHHYLKSPNYEVPRILGMTASPIKTKGGQSESEYWQKLQCLETLMNSKIYTCESESVLANYVPFSTIKYKSYQKMGIPRGLLAQLGALLMRLKEKHKGEVARYDLEKSAADSTCKSIEQIYSTLMYCLEELGLWLAWKAADFLTRQEVEDLLWGKLDLTGEKILRHFCSEVFQELTTFVDSDAQWAIADDNKLKVATGYLASSRVVTLIESLLEYSHIKAIRCIIFVERIITASVLHSLLNELLHKHNSWRSKSIAGNSSGLLRQSRKLQQEIVEEFREGKVNIIVATSILEEGLDVQSCNLVIRFDPAPTVSSFIQSRGRARMQNSDFLLLVESGDASTYSRLGKFLASGEIMRKLSLSHASVPCQALDDDLYSEEIYRVESTGAVITLCSSVEMLYFYCSRLPSDGYFKPMPRFDIDKEMGICRIHMPKSCPVPPLRPICWPGNINTLRKIACFEACKQLHRYGALTDDLIPDVVVEDKQTTNAEKEPYDDEHPAYFPTELVNRLSKSNAYHFYVIQLLQQFSYDVRVQGLVLAMRSELEPGICFKLQADRGMLTANFKYAGSCSLTEEQVNCCRKFQSTLLSVLVEHNVTKLVEVLNSFNSGNSPGIDYLILPLKSGYPNEGTVDWEPVASVLFPSAEVSNSPSSGSNVSNEHIKGCCFHGRSCLVTKDGPVCSCLLQNSVVYTPHNGRIYCISGFLNSLNANSKLNMRDGSSVTYKQYYKERYGINLRCEEQSLLKGRHIFQAQNCLFWGRLRKEKEPSKAMVELPPELCQLIIAPISINTVYSYSFAPSIIHRLESLLMAANLKRMHLDHCVQNAVIPTTKVLEALTTKQCQEEFHLESLETLGDSFLKYAVSQHLFKSYGNHHEGMLSIKRERITSNAALCKLGCECNLPGFIRDEQFDPKNWIIPGYKSQSLLNEEFVFGRKMYVVGKRKIKMKRVADVVEALIGAYVSTGGETAGVMFLDWLGIKVDFGVSPYERGSSLNESLVNIKQLEALLGYSFNDPSLLVEALTHGSFMLPEIPRCYQRLEYLGDSVLDYLITVHLYSTYPRLSPGLITDMRSASVNNDCYALAAVKVELHKHLLHASQALHRDIANTLENSDKFASTIMYGWESETSFPKVLGDIIESLAGAILVDSGYNKQKVFDSIRPLLEPLVTPETLQLHPVRELNEICQKENYTLKKPTVSRDDNGISVTVEVEAGGKIYRHTSCADKKETAKRVASRAVLKSLKQASV
ncbi:endoribonuclease Dicer homolog 2 isoform X2 [Punica granatum]|uniref:Endoribonuclease Dicer homolog 2 isoform X2 n=1 Tax=Punica granatum TaxID=22663 RepID=A0A6P8D362_PUNGR|nr:endoribonuclease Dicer homolog 2 isoform X2 [Punica granatum]